MLFYFTLVGVRTPPALTGDDSPNQVNNAVKEVNPGRGKQSAYEPRLGTLKLSQTQSSSASAPVPPPRKARRESSRGKPPPRRVHGLQPAVRAAERKLLAEHAVPRASRDGGQAGRGSPPGVVENSVPPGVVQ